MSGVYRPTEAEYVEHLREGLDQRLEACNLLAAAEDSDHPERFVELIETSTFTAGQLLGAVADLAIDLLARDDGELDRELAGVRLCAVSMVADDERWRAEHGFHQGA